MNNALIISGGDEDKISSCLNFKDFDYVAACDKGYEYALKQNISCNLVLGDFDSYSGKIPENALVLPTHKDDTDTLYAVKKLIENGAKNITITCCMGGRFDHTFSNIQTLVYAKNRGVNCRIITENQIIIPIKDEKLVLEPKAGFSFSVLSYTPVSEGVFIKNAAYELTDGTLTFDNPIGESNEFLQKNAEIGVNKGVLLIILSKII